MTICNQKKLIILLAIICTFDSLSVREQKQKIRTSNSNQHVKTPLSPKQKKTENIQVNKPQTNKKEVELNLAGLPMYETDIQSNSSPIKLEKHQVEYFRNLDQNNQENDLGDVLFRNLDKNDQKKKDEPSMGDVLFRNLDKNKKDNESLGDVLFRNLDKNKKEEPSMGDVLFRNLSGKSQNKKDNESLGDVLFRNLSGNTNKNQDNQSLGDVLFRNLARTPRQRQGVPPKQANGMNPTKGEIHNAIKKDGIVAIQNILKQKHPNLYQDEIIDNDSKSMGSTAFFRNLESQKGPNDQPSSVTYLFRNLEKEKGPHDQPSSVTYLFRNLDKGPHEQPSSVTYLFRNLESNKNKIHRVLI